MTTALVERLVQKPHLTSTGHAGPWGPPTGRASHGGSSQLPVGLAERRALTDALARTSPVGWPRIDPRGKVGFSDEASGEALHVDSAALLTAGREADTLTQPT